MSPIQQALLAAKQAGVDPAQRLAAFRTFLQLVLEHGLLLEFAQPLLALQVEPDAAVRRLLTERLVEARTPGNISATRLPRGSIICGAPQVVTKSPELLPVVLATATALVRDPSPSVAKRALVASVSLFRLAFTSICKETIMSARPELQQLWTGARGLCATACLQVRADDDGVRLQALKFLEAVILIFTASLGSHTDDTGVAMGVAPLPQQSFLQTTDLNRDLRIYLDELLACVSRQPGGPFQVVLVATLAAIARLRAPLCGEMLPPLLQMVPAPNGSATLGTQLASLRHAFKHAFIHLLRAGVPEWQDHIVAAMRSMGYEDDAAVALRQGERMAAKRERAQAERDAVEDAAAELDDDPSLLQVSKRARTDDTSPGVGPPITDASLLRQVASALAALAAAGDMTTLQNFVGQLAPPVLVDVVLHNLHFLPSVAPSDNRMAGGYATMAPAPALLELVASAGVAGMPFVKKVAPTLDETDAPMADAPALEPETLAPAPPAVAVALGNEQRGAQRRAAIHRVLHMEQRTLLHVSGGKQLRRVLLARTLRALPSISDAFVEFMFDSFETRDGLEHILQWLYCLYVDTVANTKGHVYANALLTVIKRMLATLSPRDKALPTLLVEVPALPAPVFDLLTWLCGLSHDADGVPAPDMEQRTLGLVALRDVITNRPADRDSCLDLVLRCTTHQDDVLRGKAIRMVVNQLHPLLLDAANTIVEYATQQLNSANKLVADQDAADGDAGLTEAGLQRVSLFFALCTRVAELVPKLFVSYAACSQPVQAAFHKNMVGLSRALGVESGPLLDAIKEPVPGSEALALQVLHILCDAADPVPAVLLDSARAAYTHTKDDVRFLLPCLHLLPRDEIRRLLPKIVVLSADHVVAGMRRVVSGKAGAPMGPMTAPELLVALHALDPAKDSIPLKRILEAVSLCFTPGLHDVFPPDMLAVALQQMVEQSPVPLLFMRSVIQTAHIAPQLHGFIIDLLSKLVLRQIWKTDARLWEGVLRCAKQLAPRSFAVYLQLPAAQLKEALSQSPDLTAPLRAYTATPAVRASVPGSVLAALMESAQQDPTLQEKANGGT